MESARLLLGALELLAVLALVHFRVVQLLDGCMTLRTLEAVWACAHILLILHMLAVVRTVVKDGRRSPEVAHVMCKDAVLRVMRVEALGAPTRLVLEHVEREGLHVGKQSVQIFVELLLAE